MLHASEATINFLVFVADYVEVVFGYHNELFR